MLAAHDPMGSATPQASPIRGRKGSDRKERLLRAASRVLLRHGVQALTLEAVALEARTSKGGLLHHFPSKSRKRSLISRPWRYPAIRRASCSTRTRKSSGTAG